MNALIDEAKTLDLFKAHGAFEVHCSTCHARLDPMGDCATCGLIGRPEAEVRKRAAADPAAAVTLLQEKIALRRAYKPVRGARETSA